MAGVLSLNGTFTYPIELLKTLTVDDSAYFKKSVTIGENSTVDTDTTAIAFGNSVVAKRNYSIAAGNDSRTNSLYSIAAGYKAATNGDYAIALGMTPNATHKNSFVWSGEIIDGKYSSKADGTFCINPSGTKPEQGVYIGNSNLPSLIESYAKAYVDSQPNSFTAKNTFSGGVEVNTNSFEIKSGSLTVDSSVESTFKGKVNVPTQDITEDSTLAASTAFVKDNIDTCVLKSGSTMTGFLTLHAKPVENMHAATKQYVDENATVVSVNNSQQPIGREIASITIDGSEKKLYSPQIIAGQNTTVVTDNVNGTVKISCNPNITVSGGTLKVPIGTIIPFVGTGIPGGFLFCDGRAISRTTYSELFSAIGTTFGSGDGVTTFNLPNLSDNRFLEGSSANGTYKNAGLPNIKGSLGECLYAYPSGAFYDAGGSTREHAPTNPQVSASIYTGLGFNASNLNSIYSDSVSTVQPKSVTVKYFIKYTQTTEEKYVLSVNDIKPGNNGNVSLDIPKVFLNPSQIQAVSNFSFETEYTCPFDCILRVHRGVTAEEHQKSISLYARNPNVSTWTYICGGDMGYYGSTDYMIPFKSGTKWYVELGSEIGERAPSVECYYFGLQ